MVAQVQPQLQEKFLSILPRIETHGRVYFRIKDPEAREECVAEMVALAWWWFVRLAQKGKDGTEFPSAIATFAARAVCYGRKLAGMDRAKDVMSPRAQRLHAFAVCKLTARETDSSDPLADALQDNTRSRVDVQVCFRLDFPSWLRTLGDRDRRLLEDLMMSEATSAVAAKYGLTAARVSQLRSEFLRRWRAFCSDE